MASQSPCLLLFIIIYLIKKNQGAVSFLHQMSIITETGDLAISICRSENHGAEQVLVLKIYINFREPLLCFCGFTEHNIHRSSRLQGSAASVLWSGGLSTLEVSSCIVYIPGWVSHTSSRPGSRKELKKRKPVQHLCFLIFAIQIYSALLSSLFFLKSLGLYCMHQQGSLDFWLLVRIDKGKY